MNTSAGIKSYLAYAKSRKKSLGVITSLMLLISLAACQMSPAVSTQPPLSQETTAHVTVKPPLATPGTPTQPTPTPTPLPATPTVLPTETPLACWKAGGRIEKAELEVDYLPQPLQYRVYLPPCYDELPEQHYPVLYLIHGQSFNDDQWERLGAPRLVDRLAAKGKLPPFIIVMPRDQAWSEPSVDKFGQAVVESLVPYIDASYRSLPERSKRAIGGLSRGGAWALHLGLSNWKTFGAIGMHSGFAFQSDDSNIKRWLDAIPTQQMPRFYIDISENDHRDIAESATWIKSLLTERAIAHEWHLFPGYHEEAYWQTHLEQYLRWYAETWE